MTEKLKRVLKIVLFSLISIIVLLTVLFFIYLQTHKMKKAKEFVVNKNAASKILVATQGSEFKDSLLKELVNYVKIKNIYMKVIDVSNLNKVNPDVYKSIILINSCEYSKMEENVQRFLKRITQKNKIILVVTSGKGSWKSTKFNVDTISTASKKNKVKTIFNKILKKLSSI